MKIEGRNAVLEALAAGTTIDRLVVAKGLKDAGAQKIINEAKSRGVSVKFYDVTALDRESVTKKHQGFIAEITDFKYCEVEDILSIAREKNQPNFIVIVDGVEDPHNLGSIIRVAECAGVDGIIIPKHRNVSVNETVIRVSAGASAHMKIARVTNINDTIRSFKKEGIFVFAAELGGESIYKTDLTGNMAIVVGGEDSGVKRLTKELCGAVVTLPIMGKTNSLNASVACGVVVYETLRQRGN